MLKRSGLILMLLLVSAAVAHADTPPPADTTTTTASATIADGVMLATVAVGGMTADVAAAAVHAAFWQPVVLRSGATTVKLDPTIVGLSVPVDLAVAKALAAAPGTTFALRGVVDPKKLSTFVAHLAQRFAKKAAPGRLLLRENRPVILQPIVGQALKQRVAAAAITSELARGIRTPIALPFKALKPAANSTAGGPVIVIRRASNLLTLYDGSRYVRQFRVATGQSIYPTPLGVFHIVVMWKNPWWYPPPDPWAKGEKPTPPGPGNPLGTRWMGISSPGVGIHGTPEPQSIGYSLSHGCIRMYIPSAEWLFDHVTVGTPVYIVGA
ncbi:MAG TPA: L,D-transpeptidase [Gaiellaceae bacterium]|nr:L,D-transpeptidase [Gaiellaceae bacterium]